MKTLNFFVIIFIFVTTLAIGQSNDEQEIRRLEKHWTALLDNGDTTSLLKLWSKDYVVNNPNGEIVTNVWIRSGNGWNLTARQSSEVIRK